MSCAPFLTALLRSELPANSRTARRKNLNALERIQCEKVSVPGHDVRCLACTASSRNLSSFGSRQAAIRTSISAHLASPVRAARKASDVFLIHIAKEFFPAENLVRRARPKRAGLFLLGEPGSRHDEVLNREATRHWLKSLHRRHHATMRL